MLEGEECSSSQYAPCYKVRSGQIVSMHHARRVRNIQVVSMLEGEEWLGSQYAPYWKVRNTWVLSMHHAGR